MTLPSGSRAAQVALVCATILAACAPEARDSNDNAGTETAPVRVCATGTTVQGVDVSVYNGTVDWAQVKASGRVFAIARVSDGLNSLDSKFAADWSGIRAEGLVRGVYQYFEPGQNPVAQADLLVSKIGSLEPGDLPPIIDVETAGGQSNATIVANVKAWLDEIEAKLGVKGIIYCASGFWNALPNTSQFSSNIVWVANYGVSCPSMPTPWTHWSMWQYSGTGTCPGMTGEVDLDVFNGTLAELQAITVGASGSSSGGGTTTSSSGASSSSSGGATSSSSSSSGGTGGASSSSTSSSGGVTPTPCVADGVDGTCIDTATCAAMPGYTSTAGLCPGAANVECCTEKPAAPPPTSCTVGTETGTCIETTTCAAMPGYTSTAGHCPGAADVECCTPPPSCTVGNVTGVCILTSACASMAGSTSTPGHCAGAADIECCTM
jgi:lysozyme